MRKLLLAGIILALSSCATIYIPHKEELRRIENLPYEKGVFDCKHKAVMYADYVTEKGLKARVISGEVGVGFNKSNHAWVEVKNPKDNKWYIIDPTDNSEDAEEGFDTSQYFSKTPRYIYGDGVSVEDIIKHKNVGEYKWV